MLAQIDTNLSETARRWWNDARDRAKREGERSLPELLPALARRIGRTPYRGGPVDRTTAEPSPSQVDLSAWRLCDAAGAQLLLDTTPPDATLIDLYLHGDQEERTILLRTLALLPVTDATVRLLEEVQRSNQENHFKAASCDSNLVVRATAHEQFGEAGFNRLVLKFAFLGLELDRLFEAQTRANPELSRMLQDLATEREAAGRSVWPGTNILIGHAPTAGSAARIIGGLEHGDDRQRLAAAIGILAMGRREWVPLIEERLQREPRPEIQDALRAARLGLSAP